MHDQIAGDITNMGEGIKHIWKLDGVVFIIQTFTTNIHYYYEREKYT